MIHLEGRKSYPLLGFIAALLVIVGVGIGMLLSSHIKIDNKVTLDGILNGTVAIIAIIAATFILPATVQRSLKRQSAIITVTHEDVKTLLTYIEDVLLLYADLNSSNKAITENDRKAILRKHTQIVSLATILKSHSDSIDALCAFDEDVYQPLMDSKAGFAENALPKHKLTDKLYLEAKGNLDQIVKKLREIRYKLN